MTMMMKMTMKMMKMLLKRTMFSSKNMLLVTVSRGGSLFLSPRPTGGNPLRQYKGMRNVVSKVS